MARDGVVGDLGSSLRHIYFFVDDKASTSTSYSNGHSQHPSRGSSPGSMGAASMTTATASSVATLPSSACGLNPRATDFQPEKIVARALPGPLLPPSPTCLYELRQTANRGIGLFATTNIARGVQVFSEEPLLQVPEGGAHLVWDAYCRLESVQKAAFNALYCSEPAGKSFEQTNRLLLVNPLDKSRDEKRIEEVVAEQVRVMNIFSINSLDIPPHSRGVCATASRLNHSCVPNVHQSYNPTLRKVTVHAVNDIRPGEELVAGYLGGAGCYMTGGQRGARLLEAYGFVCCCSSCVDHTGVSDHRRHVLSQITWGIKQYTSGAPPQMPFIPDGPAQAIRQTEDIVNLMMAENIFTIELAKAYRLASGQALLLRDYTKALEYAYNEEEVERNCLGTVLDDIVEFGNDARTWVKYVQGIIRAEKGESGLRKSKWHKMPVTEEQKARKKKEKKTWNQKKKNKSASESADEFKADRTRARRSKNNGE